MFIRLLSLRSHYIPVLSIPLKGSPIQHLSVIRMSNRNQQPCTFLQRLSIQIHRTIFRHHPLHIRSGCNHPGSRLQHRNNLLIPLLVLEASAITAFPPFDILAPRTKSSCPPVPEKIRIPIESAQTCPVRSISVAELMEITFKFLEITYGLFVY